MTPKTNALRRIARSGARSLAYSTPSRNLARRLVEDPSAHKVREYLEKKGHGHELRRLASQQLPEGTYFAKLTIKNWSKHRNKSFRLLQNGQVVYGNRIEAPSRGFDPEYRNIIVTSDDLKDFSLDIKADYTLLIGRGAFTTAEQQRYDEQHGVDQHGDLFYSLRGNLRNPKRALITFPGFSPSTSRISYAVNPLQGLSDADLDDTVVICFQDRYMVAGSYMLVDNAGDSLRDRVNSEISRLLGRFGIAEEDLLLFGASKGASIATLYAEKFPRARIVAVAPEMNLPYHLSTPFFRDSLLRLDAIRHAPQPGTLMRRYFAEGRTIDYLYTDEDEQSNYSLIEFVSDVPGLTKYRIDGDRESLTKKAMPTVLTLLKQFARGGSDSIEAEPLGCDQAVPFLDEYSMGVQLRLSNSSQIRPSAQSNVLLDGHLGRTRFRQLLTDHELAFIKYTAPNQRLRRDLHATAEMTSVLLTTSSGDHRCGAFPALTLTELSDESGSPSLPSWSELELTPSASSRTHSLLAAGHFGVSTFEYVVTEGAPAGDHVRVVFTGPAGETRQITPPDSWGEPRIVVDASVLTEPTGLAQFVHRLAIAAGADAVHVVFEDSNIEDAALDSVRLLDRLDLRCEDRRHPSEPTETTTETTE